MISWFICIHFIFLWSFVSWDCPHTGVPLLKDLFMRVEALDSTSGYLSVWVRTGFVIKIDGYMVWICSFNATQGEWQRRISGRQDTSSCSQRIITLHLKQYHLPLQATWDFLIILCVQSTRWDSLWISSSTCSDPTFCQSWLQQGGMQLYLGCHSRTQSTVCRLTKRQSSQRANELNPNLLESKHLWKLQDAGLRKVRNG